ncbi:hypothetical protein BV25DRAFT_1780405, partial [Artomyces pyxidatus]
HKTAGRSAVPIFFTLIERWPTPAALSQADPEALKDCIRSLGLQSTRSKRLIDLSRAYLQYPPVEPQPIQSKYYTSPSAPAAQYSRNHTIGLARQKISYPVATAVSHLPGSGPYAMDSYRIYCGGAEEWKKVMPNDKELIRYLKWRWAVAGMQWSPVSGVIGPAAEDYLELLIEELMS